MARQTQRYLVTSALPYANGPLHFGHLGGVYIPADIYTRHRRLQGHEIKHICGSDEHGVAIMIAAEKEKMDYRSYVDRWHANHAQLFKKYGVEFDFFGRTSEKYHEEEVVQWFKTLNERGFIGKKAEKQLYCIDDARFLPDRYVEGTCYVCTYPNARGDECPNCGEWIDPIRLIQPRSKISGSRNIEIRESEHYYLLLTRMEQQFREWFKTKQGEWRSVVTGFVNGLLEKGTIDRAISRDLDWGIDVPLSEAKGKKLYVWFDAPIGYVSNLKRHLELTGSTQHYLKDWWNAEGVEISHFIGKDNIIFHAYIWPCMIQGTGFIRLPTELPANEFVNLEGKQFSKSSGWYVDAERAVEEFGMDPLRFYLCSIIPETGDSSFSWDAFASANEEFGNKIGNFVHRTLTFVEKHFPEGLGPSAFVGLETHSELQVIRNYHAKITAALDAFQFTRGHAELILFSQAANEFFHAQAPWKQIKEDRDAAARTLAMAVVTIASLAVILEPFVPGVAGELKKHFEGYLGKKDIADIYLGDIPRLVSIFQKGYKSPVPPKVLVPRIDAKVIQKWKEELCGSFAKAPASTPAK